VGLKESLSLKGMLFFPLEVWPFVEVQFVFIVPLRYSLAVNVESDGAMPGFPGGGTR